MSYWITLGDAKTDDPVSVDRHEEGGTCVLGGTSEATINVTYNYGRFFRFPDLDGRTGQATEMLLRSAAAELGTSKDKDYWAATPGNAGATVVVLLGWAEQYPDAVWRVT